MRLIASILLLLSTRTVFAEECDVPGNTVLWTMAYCMSMHETDDEAHPGVNECFLSERKLQNKKVDQSCKVNQLYKTALCSMNKERELIDSSIFQCVNSNDMIPSIVKNGGI